MSTTYPRTVDGVTLWACCASSIGPTCHHRAEPNDRAAFFAKEDGHAVLNQRIQNARDEMRCTCSHKNVSHGYPESDRDGSIGGYFQKWPGGSFIGMGACGIEGCNCPGFQFQEGANA